MTLFILLTSLVILQRLGEMVYARLNEKRMKEKGAIEVGKSHYKWIVLMHVLFFVSFIIEGMWRGAEVGFGWIIFLLLFLFAQFLRVWTLVSLGTFWNTKIIILPGSELVKKGPYRWVSHPNYMIVAIELATLPLVFGAWVTAFVFTIANAFLLLFVRIPVEEKALKPPKEGSEL